MYKRILACLLAIACIFLSFSPTQTDPIVVFPAPAVQESEYIAVLDTSALSDSDIRSVADLSAYLPDSATCLELSFPYVLLTPTKGVTKTDMLQDFESCSYITSIEPNYVVASTAYTNDHHSDRQWALHHESYGLHAIQAWPLYEQREALRTVTVAIIDTGVDYQHPDLIDAMWQNPDEIPDDGIDNDGNGYVDDIYGWDFYHGDNTICHYSYDENGKPLADPTDSDNHGTHVAGILAATANNGIGIAGATGNLPVKIMSLKALGGGTASSPGTGSMFQTIKAIQYATNMGADICNLSWGNSTYSSALEQAIRESNMLFVAAAGNTGSNNNSSPVYPASLPLDNIISVTGMNKAGELAEFANYGTNSVDMAAPAEQISSTIVGTYASMSGTSMAVPHVSAVAAMLYTTSDHLYASNIREILISSGQQLPGLEGKLRQPIIPDALAAAECIEYLHQDTEAPIFDWKITYETANIEVSIDATDIGGSGIRTIRYIFGDKKLKSFRHGTEGLAAEDGTAWLSKPGYYTFYVSDYAGNETIQLISVEQVPSESLVLPHTRKTMKKNWTYQLKYEILPADHTDAVTFISSDPAVLQVDCNGLVTAHSRGWADVEIRTASGLSSIVRFKVR